MRANNNIPHCRQSWPWWRWGLTGLSAMGLAWSAVLSWHYLAGGSLMGCTGASPCDEVLNSRWSSIAGILPVSSLAVGTYLAILVASFCIGPTTEEPVRVLAWRAMLILAGAAAGSAVWFIFVQRSFIGAFCPYCLAAHITGLLLAALIITQAGRHLCGGLTQAVRGPNQKAANQRGKMALPVFGSFSVGLFLAVLLMLSQICISPPAVNRVGESQDQQPVLDAHNLPLIGSPDANCVVTLLFDYKCPHCQQLHLMLDEVVRRFDGRVAFALCPTPLSTNCNPYIPRNVDEFADSCELAKVGLAVWVAKRDAFPAFDRWMFSYESGDRWQPRSLEDAKAKAVALVGPAKFATALADPWINQYLQTSIHIYGNTLQGGNMAVPKLVFGSRWVIPGTDDADDLVKILLNKLGVPSGSPAQNANLHESKETNHAGRLL